MKPSVLSKFFENIETYGGTATCRILYRRVPMQGHKQEQISHVRFQVDILVPFPYGGKQLVAVGVGVYAPKTTFLVNSLEDVDYPFQQGRMNAFKLAIKDMLGSVRNEMLKARPTTSRRKQEKRIRTLCSRLGVTGLV